MFVKEVFILTVGFIVHHCMYVFKMFSKATVTTLIPMHTIMEEKQLFIFF